MTNPATELINWLKKQDNDVQLDIAFIISAMHPSFDFDSLPSKHEELLEHFYSRIGTFSGTDFRNTGFIVAFRGIFDFFIAKKRSSVKGWDEPKRFFETLLRGNKSQQPPSLKGTAQMMLSDLPSRCEKWVAICHEWKKLKGSALSDKAIDAWETSNLLARNSDVDNE